MFVCYIKRQNQDIQLDMLYFPTKQTKIYTKESEVYQDLPFFFSSEWCGDDFFSFLYFYTKCSLAYIP